MDVYGLDISKEQGFQMMADLLHTDSKIVELVYKLRAEIRKAEVQELLQRELEYIDPQIILRLASGKSIPARGKRFQVETGGKRFLMK